MKNDNRLMALLIPAWLLMSGAAAWTTAAPVMPWRGENVSDDVLAVSVWTDGGHIAATNRSGRVRRSSASPSAPASPDDGAIKFSDTRNKPIGFDLQSSDRFGSAAVALGDLDGNGATDYAVGAEGTAETGGASPANARAGAVYILLMNTDGLVSSTVRIARDSPADVAPAALTADIQQDEDFGDALAALGDLDGDGIEDLAVGASNDRNANDLATGAVYVLFLNTNGTVKSFRKHGGTAFAGIDTPNFGNSVANLGDLDGGGSTATALAVGAPGDGGIQSGFNKGSVFILFLNADATVASSVEISDFITKNVTIDLPLDAGDFFGTGVAAIGDLDRNGTPELAVGAAFDDDGGSDRGALYILFMNGDGTAGGFQKISHADGGFGGGLDDVDEFGRSVGVLSDLDGDGMPEVLVGAPGDDDAGPGRGAAWIIFLKNDGTVKAKEKVSAAAGDLGSELDDADEFGFSIASAGDLNGDGIPDLLVGAPGDDDGADGSGAIYVVTLTPPVVTAIKTDALFTDEAQQIVDVDANGLVDPGDEIEYTVVLANQSLPAARDLVFTDTPGSSAILVPGSVTTTLGAVVLGNGGGDADVRVDIPALTGGGTATITFRVLVSSPFPAGPASVRNQGTVSGSNFDTANTDDPDTPAAADATVTPIDASPAVAATKTDALSTDQNSDGAANPGDVIRYTVVIINTGDQDAGPGLAFLDTPDATTPLAAGSTTTTQGTINSGNDAGDATVDLALGTVAGLGGTVTVTFDVSVPLPLPADALQASNQGTISGGNIADVLTDDPGTTATADATVTPLVAAPVVTAMKTATVLDGGKGYVAPGDLVHYEVTITNSGDRDASGVTFTDTPDPMTTIVPGSVKVTAGTVTGGNDGIPPVNVEVGTLAGSSASLVIAFDVQLPTPIPSFVSNQGMASGTNFDDVPTDDPAVAGDADPTVVAFDVTPPVITVPSDALMVWPVELWPPSHKYTTISLDGLVTAHDDVSGDLSADVRITLVTSDEPEDAPGDSDGATLDDIIIAEGCRSVDMRAERDDNANGRVYGITVKVADAAKNVATATFHGQVPLSSNGEPAVKDEPPFDFSPHFDECAFDLPQVQIAQAEAIHIGSIEATVEGSDVRVSWQADDPSTRQSEVPLELEVEHRTPDKQDFAAAKGKMETETGTYRVTGLTPGIHYFRIKQVLSDGTEFVSEAVEILVELPGEYVLTEAYPNPFNPLTQLSLVVRQEQRVVAEVYDGLGRQVRVLLNEQLERGRAYIVRLDAGNLASGLYVIRVAGETFDATRRVLLLK